MERGGIFQELVGSEDADKVREIGNATALLSGEETAADELLARCDKFILDFQVSDSDADDFDLKITKLLSDLRSAAAKRKWDLIDHHLRMSAGMGYSNFLKLHKEKLNDDHARRLWSEINHIDLGCDLLINIVLNEPLVIRLDRYGKTHWETNYSVVGTGMDIAFSFLCQHPWNDHPDLMTCLYRVFEAKVAAQANRHVGESTVIEVLFSGGQRFNLSQKAFDLLNRTYNKKRQPPKLAFSPDLLEISEDQLGNEQLSDSPNVAGNTRFHRRSAADR